MKILKQTTDYGCVIASVAMCTGDTIEMLEKFLVHNPEEIIYPKEVGPRRFRGIQIEDMLPIIYELGFVCMPFFRCTMINNKKISFHPRAPLDDENGILMYDIGHVVAWDCKSQMIYDPIGYTRELNLNWEEFWMIRERY